MKFDFGKWEFKPTIDETVVVECPVCRDWLDANGLIVKDVKVMARKHHEERHGDQK